LRLAGQKNKFAKISPFHPAGSITKKIGRVVVKEQGKSEHLLFNRSLTIKT
jgi:hypothetical protein